MALTLRMRGATCFQDARVGRSLFQEVAARRSNVIPTLAQVPWETPIVLGVVFLCTLLSHWLLTKSHFGHLAPRVSTWLSGASDRVTIRPNPALARVPPDLRSMGYPDRFAAAHGDLLTIAGPRTVGDLPFRNR